MSANPPADRSEGDVNLGPQRARWMADVLGPRSRALVEREDEIAHEMGVTGVPAMIFGNRLAVSGAREPELLVSVIDRVMEMAAQQAADPATATETDEE